MIGNAATFLLPHPTGDNQGLVGGLPNSLVCGLPNSLVGLERQPVMFDDQGFQGRAVVLGQQS